MHSSKQKLLLELWGGVECTVNRVHDQFVSQLDQNGHHQHALRDFERFKSLGIKAFRVPVLWERVAPDGLESADWHWSDAALDKLRELEINPIVGLLHHGSGPISTNLLDPEFPKKLAVYARAVAERYPWVLDWTPVNEPLTTARFSALYGHWYPHAQDSASFARATINQCKGVVLAIQAIRAINPEARLVQTEDLGKTWSTPSLAYQADFENERRWVSLDLISGQLKPGMPMWHGLLASGIAETELDWFLEHAHPPGIIGINHYLTSERFLDERLDRYPTHTHGGNGRDQYADVEAVRVLEPGPQGPYALLREAWQRYNLPLAITECHLGCTREEQLRWLETVWRAASAARREGADVRAVTAWSLLGAFDWDTLLTQVRGRYEPGVFDIRGGAPRPTALANALSELARGETLSSPVATGAGWWVRPERLEYPPVVCDRGLDIVESFPSVSRRSSSSRALFIVGTDEVLNDALERSCRMRGLEHHRITGDLIQFVRDLAIPELTGGQTPWAIICTSGFETAQNNDTVEQLAQICDKEDTRLLLFSSQQRATTLVSDPTDLSVANTTNNSTTVETRLLEAIPDALLVQRGLSFDPWTSDDNTVRALQTLNSGGVVRVLNQGAVTTSYIPDLLQAALDLLIDHESGIWSLEHRETVNHVEFVRSAARIAGLNVDRIEERILEQPRVATFKAQTALLPPLEDALERFVEASRPLWIGNA
jgi:dTDP-4-dehydrorhamnose reductase